MAEANQLPYFLLDASQLDDTAAYVEAVLRRNYPALDIPHHARWRHLATGGVDRWGALASSLAGTGTAETVRIRIDLCATSVLLDAGAGRSWSYCEPGTGLDVRRSEGLAVASFHAFRAGLFSSDPTRPLRADADGLARVSAASLAQAFQVTARNPLAGLDGRAALLRDLGHALRRRPDLFPGARLGGLYDALAARATTDRLPARDILIALLDGLAPIWPRRLVLAGRNLGDVWRHSALAATGPGGDLIPFHKLSQWLAYSLVEVFEEAGFPVTGLDALTGLPEYRNGGLFLDMGVLRLRDPALAQATLPVDHEAVVEWRALTVALLDRLAPLIRDRLGRSESELPLSRILEGGTWAAGRSIAAERRQDGGPPLRIVSDGTVF